MLGIGKQFPEYRLNARRFHRSEQGRFRPSTAARMPAIGV